MRLLGQETIGIGHGPRAASRALSLALLSAAVLYAFATSAVYLFEDNRLKTKRPPLRRRPFPSLERLDDLNHRLLSWGFPLLTLGSALLWLVLVRVTHKASLASIVVVVTYPIAVALAGHPWGDVTVIAVVALFVIARHASNIKRLFRGEELGLDPGARDDGDG